MVKFIFSKLPKEVKIITKVNRGCEEICVMITRL